MILYAAVKQLIVRFTAVLLKRHTWLQIEGICPPKRPRGLEAFHSYHNVNSLSGAQRCGFSLFLSLYVIRRRADWDFEISQIRWGAVRSSLSRHLTEIWSAAKLRCTAPIAENGVQRKPLRTYYQ